MKDYIAFFIAWLICVSLFAQNDRTVELLDPECMKSGSASIAVYDLDKAEEIYSYDPDRALPTASIQKLLTTSAILHERGADFHYHTEIGYTGTVVDGALKGDLVVTGSGDPTLGSGYFDAAWNIERIADSLLSRFLDLGIKSVTGGLIIDGHKVPGQHVPPGWPWSDLGNYYGAGHWAINIYDNEYKIYFRQNNTPGSATEILRTIPGQLPFTFTSEVRTGLPGSGDQAYIYAAPYSVVPFVRGTIPPGQGSFSIRGSLTNPPQLFGTQLIAILKESSITFGGGLKLPIDQKQNVTSLFSILSPPLLDIIRVTNFRSVNLYAEGLLKLLCNEDQSVSLFECGLTALKSFWSEQGLDDDQYFFKDGSGLSPRNTASSKTFVDALRTIYNDRLWYDSFITTLPEMGRDGTLRYMLRGYNGSGTIHAKSGYIGRQRSYTGYIVTENGHHLAFCVMLDNYGCSSTRMRQKIERFLIEFLKE